MASSSAPRATSAVEWAETQFDSEFEDVLNRIIGENGPAPGTEKATTSDEIELWGTQDPRFDRDLFMRTMMTTGFPPEVAQEMLVVQEHPELAELLSQPIPDEELSGLLADIVEWPFRHGLYAHLDDPDERVKVADRINRGWLKSLGESVNDGETADAAPPERTY